MAKVLTLTLLLFTLFVGSAAEIRAQAMEFTYQGSLKDGANAADGNFDFEFLLFDSLAGGVQHGATLSRNSVAVANGIFSANLDFGNQFPGVPRFLEIRVRPTAGGAFTTLAPRQIVNSAPYSVKSLNTDNAITATNAAQLGGVAANQYVVTTDPRMTDARPPTAGSPSYIQNQNAAPQASGNFNVSGNGAVGGTLSGNIVNATTQYNLGGSRFSGVFGSNNTFTGSGAGAALTTGVSNSMFGRSAGTGTTSGSNNTFVGVTAGNSNITGGNNTVVGANADVASSNLSFATAIGSSAVVAVSNTVALGRSDGSDKVVIPGNVSANRVNTATTYTAGIDTLNGLTILSNEGTNNIFVGVSAGLINSGIENSFFGRNAGDQNAGGGSNSFYGMNSGRANGNGNNNTIMGSRADIDISNRSFATAIGSGAIVTASNRVQLGRNGTDTVSIGALTAASATHVCINGTVLSSCSSSARYKENINGFGKGLDIVRRLRPVTFVWKERNEPDLGLIAEEVAEIEPLLVTHDVKGVIEGVKYDQIGVVLINAVKEQQAQIEGQQKEIDELKQTGVILQQKLAEQTEASKRLAAQVEALKSLLCRSDPKADICKE